MNKTYKLLTLAFLLIPIFANSQSTNWMYAQDALREATTQDIFGNTYSTGKLIGSTTIGSTTYTSAGSNDVLITKTDANGNVIWISQFGGTGSDIPTGIDKGQGNDLWITGTFAGTLNAGGFTLTSNGGNDVFAIAIDPLTGSVLNAVSGGGGGAESVFGIEVLTSGDVFIAGSYDTPFTFGSVTLSTPGGWTPFIIKLNSNGVIQWGTDVTNASAWSMTADESGNAYISGFSVAASIDVAGVTVPMNGNDHWTSKFDANGNYVWTALSDFNGEIVSLDVDDNGNVFFAGNYDTQATFGSISLIGNGADEVLIGKILPTGAFDWVYSIGGGGWDNATEVAVDDNGYVYFCGSAAGTIDFLGTNISGKHLSKFDIAGNLQWVIGSSGGGTTTFYDLDAMGNRVLLSGYGDGFLNFGNDTITLNASHVLIDINGNANRITGNVFNDDNGNGMVDVSETGLPNALVTSSPFAITSSNASGEYSLFVNSGTYSTSMPNPPLYYNLTTPASYNVTFPGNGDVEDSINFGLLAIPNMDDLRINISSITAPKAGYVLGYLITYKNVGTTDQIVTIDLTADNSVNFLQSSPAVSSQSGNIYTWDLGLINAQEQGNIFIHFNIPATAQIGDLINSNCTISPNVTDQVPSDNSASVTDAVVGPYDPNYKSVDIDTLYDITGESWLDYEIHFQNLGNAPAQNILVIDTLDDTYLDLSSFELIASSHYPIELTFDYNKVAKFYYPGINLPDSTSDLIGSMGMVRFRIKQNGTLPLNSSIENFGDIYFDFEDAVRTNTATTFHTSSTGNVQELDALNFVVYPNPTSNKLNIALPQEGALNQVQIFDLLGNLVYQESINSIVSNHTLDVSNLSAGNYFISLDFDGVIVTKMIVVE